MAETPSLPKDAYTIGWICARSFELAAAIGMLDEVHTDLREHDPSDHNTYRLGKISNHNVALACLPAGNDGMATAATVAKDMLRTFTNIRICLLVGVAGGVPTSENDIRLGDVVVSIPNGDSGGVVQFDKGKVNTSNFERIGSLNHPPRSLLAAINSLEADHVAEDPKYPEFLKKCIGKNSRTRRNFQRPGIDILYNSTYQHHPESKNCQNCDATQVIHRHDREEIHQVHYGTIASSSQVIEDSIKRDYLGKQFNAYCLETEAAGLMLDFPCLVIRGISNYSDSHKSAYNAWEGHAAAVAAAYAKELLHYVAGAQVLQEKRATDLAQLGEYIRTIPEVIREVESQSIRRETSKEELECMRAFNTSLFEKHKNVNPLRVAGTCNWFLSHTEYAAWCRQSHGVLWVSADPGCGKSVLARHIVDERLKQESGSGLTGYFFFKDNEEQNKVCTALCALLYQLFEYYPSLIHYAVDSWKQKATLLSEPEELWRILRRVVKDPAAGQVTFILDALDECRSEDQDFLIHKLQNFGNDSAPGNACTKFLVTSRPYKNLKSGLANHTIHIPGEESNDEISAEINLVIDYEVDYLAASEGLKPEVRRALRKKLRETPNRTYLWLHLILDEIKHRRYIKKTAKGYIDAIESLPQTVDAAYESILNRHTKQREETALILHIVVGATRPLTLKEMGIALEIAVIKDFQSISALDVEGPAELKDRIRNLCGLFVFINDSRIYLIHQTAKEFLLASPSKPASPQENNTWKSSMTEQQCHLPLSLICIQYLLANDFENNTDYQFGEYCCRNWPDHYREAQFLNEVVAFEKAKKLHSPQFLPQWCSTYNWELSNVSNHGQSAILSTAYCGHYLLLQSLFEGLHVASIDQKEKDTALIIATRKGYPEIATIVIQQGANLEATDGSHMTSLALAVSNDNMAMVEFLVEKGASLEPTTGDTPLARAASNDNMAMVEFLVEKGASLEPTTGDTPLARAASNDNMAMVQFLVEKGASLEPTTGDTPLARAASNDNMAMVQFLVEKGASLEPTTGDTPLARATERGNMAMVQFLLKKGASLEPTTGDTPLARAAERGNMTMVEFLVEKGASLEPTTGDTPLARVAERSNMAMVQFLLEKGASLEPTTGDTPLANAAWSGNMAMVQFLLKKGASLEPTTGDTPLANAAWSGNMVMVQFLLKKGASLEPTTGDTPLARAAERGNMASVEFLLEKGASLEPTTGNTPLANAAWDGNMALVEFLHEKGASLEPTTGDTPLASAALKGNMAMVQFLLKIGAKVDVVYNKQRTPVWSAAMNSRIDIVRYLLSIGAHADLAVLATYVEGKDPSRKDQKLREEAQKAQQLVEKIKAELRSTASGTTSPGEHAREDSWI